MPADEVHHESSAGEPRARTGPRHAAPRKPLFTRLQVPAGKAIAIAAMPTAVLMGMGLTPTLAQAKPGVPDNPFQDGPCVTAPDKEAGDADKDAADKAKEEQAKKDAEEAAEKDAADKAKKDDAKKDDGAEKDEAKKDDAKEPNPSTSPSSGDKADSGDEAEPTPKPSGGADDKKSEPDPEPTETKNPWDPLGVGEAIKDAFTPDEKKSETPKPDPSDAKESESPESSKDPVKDTTDKVTKPVEDTLGKAKDGIEDGADKAKDGVDKAKDGAGEVADDVEKAAKDAADKAERDKAEDAMAPDENGKKPFPCVVEKKDAGEGETPPAPIPNQPWNLEASSLTLKGADYQGVVNLTMPNGKTKQALKYVVQNTDIGDLHQIVEGPGGRKYHVEAAKGTTSTIRGGETTMYTERISGKLFGLIPITFDPEHPPPLNIPLIYFTDVKVLQAGQFGGNLTVPGLQQSITD
ncbi:hypothetical protein [Streptomyces kanamyceticus]|uniref:Hydrogenase expression protein HypF n=1 Tax=Streptomyces kanamyceticus TaxID=1967 RepID=A0A5J6G9S2_STRKN|nr:hypothetical protein [Streptomyces kanamyceticus]QEU91737.1 hypothetical protein CP970_13355 [Streptomyces kanamyceticus]